MKYKMIQVEEKTHTKAKRMAKKRGMTLRGYIKMLIEEERSKDENN